MTIMTVKVPRIALNIKRDPQVGPPLLQRLADPDDHTALNGVARDALASYFLLSDRAVRSLTLKEREVMVLLDVVRDWPVTPENALYLAGELEKAPALVERHGADGVGLLRTLRNMEPFAVVALTWTLKAAWTTAPRYGGSVRAAARALGLPVGDAGEAADLAHAAAVLGSPDDVGRHL